MSTILEWARRSLDGTATQIIVDNSNQTNGVKGDVAGHKPYDRLLPKESDVVVANGCSDVIATTPNNNITKNGTTLVIADEPKYQNGVNMTPFVAEQTV